MSQGDLPEAKVLPSAPLATVIDGATAPPPPNMASAAAEVPHPTPAFDDTIPPEEFTHRLVHDLKFPQGLATSLVRNARQTFADRIWIVDNSGSMSIADGKVIHNLDDPKATKMITATRWAELGSTVKFAGNIAAITQAPTTFRLLNPPRGANQIVTVQSHADVPQIVQAMDTSPTMATPLYEHITLIVSDILSRRDLLVSQGKTVVVVIATDGLPSDCNKHEMGRALQQLNGAPVHVVIRLCTDESDVGDFWNDVDAQLEFPLDVLDDFEGEAEEIYKVNSWLTYGYPLHAAREFGMSEKVFDLLDERPLIPSQVREVLELMFGWSDLPQPEVEPEQFLQMVESELKGLPLVWDPVKKSAQPWIKMSKLKSLTKKSGCLIA